MLPNAALIDRAVTNLIGNAEKYAPGTERIEIRGWSDGDEAVLSVTDFGIGIPEADRHLVFEPHFRATNALPCSGTGMGLSIVRDVIRLHGGSMGIDSAPGRGTTFVLRLPVRAASSRIGIADFD